MEADDNKTRPSTTTEKANTTMDSGQMARNIRLLWVWRILQRAVPNSVLQAKTTAQRRGKEVQVTRLRIGHVRLRKKLHVPNWKSKLLYVQRRGRSTSLSTKMSRTKRITRTVKKNMRKSQKSLAYTFRTILKTDECADVIYESQKPPHLSVAIYVTYYSFRIDVLRNAIGFNCVLCKCF